LRKLSLERVIERVFNWVYEFETKINGGEMDRINQEAWENNMEIA
jgi:hypothetical protein